MLPIVPATAPTGQNPFRAAGHSGVGRRADNSRSIPLHWLHGDDLRDPPARPPRDDPRRPRLPRRDARRPGGDALLPEAARPRRAEVWLRRQLGRYDEHGYGFWLALDRATREPVGQAGLIPRGIEGADETDVGYLIHRPYWRQGARHRGRRRLPRLRLRGPPPAPPDLLHPAREPSPRRASRGRSASPPATAGSNSPGSSTSSSPRSVPGGSAPRPRRKRQEERADDSTSLRSWYSGWFLERFRRARETHQVFCLARSWCVSRTLRIRASNGPERPTA